ncbi:MAG TPA: bifunctional riboflavin kinase/FAD synthetase [Polyangiales bacterium]|nr:bifunctional riboflavin kinase/FAD synthetase [Polyangiales bacterium]
MQPPDENDTRPVEARERQTVVTPGNYDGVHLGHRALLRAAREAAGEELAVVAYTFDPHPTHVIAPDRAPPLLTSLQRRVELLRAAGAERVVVQKFDRAFQALSPREFVEQVLVAELNARVMVVGSDFRFGAQRAGDVAMLGELGAPHGIVVKTVPPVTNHGEIVSSSRVRSLLTQGHVEDAARLLTRVHDLERRVLHGQKRGRTIGFPTANLELSGLLAPADGVYAVSVRVLDGQPSERLLGVANLGVRPTVSGGRSMEVHILDFAADLYDRTLRVGFVARLRGEQKFGSLDDLKAQIARDVQAGRDALAQAEPELLAWI